MESTDLNHAVYKYIDHMSYVMKKNNKMTVLPAKTRMKEA